MTVQPSSSQHRLTVHGMAPRARHALELALEGPGRGTWVVNDQSPEVGIVDMDHIDATRIWQEYRLRYPHLPTLVLTARTLALKDATTVRKPVRVATLMSSLTSISPAPEAPGPNGAFLAAPRPTPPAVEPAVAPPGARPQARPRVGTHRPPRHGADRVSHAMEGGLAREVCGHALNIDPDDPEAVARAYYDPRRCLQGMLREAARRSEEAGVPVGIEGLPARLIVDADAGRLITGATDRELRAMSLLPSLDQDVHFGPPSSTSPLTEEERGQGLEAALWRVALWAARGRLPRGQGLRDPVHLRRWPDFPRLLVTPNALRIAAVWAGTPCSVLTAARVLGIPQRFVFGLYSALEAVELVEPRAAAGPADVVEMEPSLSPGLAARRGLLQKVMDRLRELGSSR